MNVSATISTSFLERKTSKLKLNANYLDLIYSTAIKHPSRTPHNYPTINISNSTISEIFKSNDCSDKLEEIFLNNSSYQEFTFYTDGSVTDIGTEQSSMGIGWVQVNNANQVLHKFSAKIYFWPSAYKAELFSIQSAISTVSHNATIQIYTDSQSVISKFYKLSTQLNNPNKLFKFNTWPLWHILLNIIKSFNLNIHFHKVQAHTDNIFNNMADSLAKQHTFSLPLNFQYTNIYNPFHILQWEQNFVELPTRHFIKNICKAHILAMWFSQKRNNEWAHINHHIDWQSTWLYLNHNQ